MESAVTSALRKRDFCRRFWDEITGRAHEVYREVPRSIGDRTIPLSFRAKRSEVEESLTVARARGATAKDVSVRAGLAYSLDMTGNSGKSSVIDLNSIFVGSSDNLPCDFSANLK